MTCHELERRLDAYVDHELPPADSQEVEAHLAICGACARRVADRESLGRLIRALPYHAAPEALRASIAAAPKPRRFASPFLAAAAVLVAAVALGGVAVRMSRQNRAAPIAASVPDQIVDSHVRALMADHLFDVRSTDQHTVKPWFLGRLDFSPPVQDLASQGFPLVGGRLEYVAGHAAAALVYQRRQHTINLFVWPEPAGTPPAGRLSLRGFNVRHWNRGEMTFWAVSDLNDAELGEFERALEQRL